VLDAWNPCEFLCQQRRVNNHFVQIQLARLAYLSIPWWRGFCAFTRQALRTVRGRVPNFLNSRSIHLFCSCCGQYAGAGGCAAESSWAQAQAEAEESWFHACEMLPDLLCRESLDLGNTVHLAQSRKTLIEHLSPKRARYASLFMTDLIVSLEEFFQKDQALIAKFVEECAL